MDYQQNGCQLQYFIYFFEIVLKFFLTCTAVFILKLQVSTCVSKWNFLVAVRAILHSGK